MNITELSIGRSRKSIRCLTMHHDLEQALILVGQDGTGKTVVLDANSGSDRQL